MTEADVWPHCVDTSAHSLLPAIDWSAACARLRVRQVRDVALRASRIDDERRADRSTADGGAKTCGGRYGASPSMFDHGGTIEVQS